MSPSASPVPRSQVGMFCRVSTMPAGLAWFSSMTFQAAATSLASPGRTTSRPGMARSEASCSTGWWVGPSSPRPIESCVQTYSDGTPIRAPSRIAGRW